MGAEHPKPSPELRLITVSELSQHNSLTDLWLVVAGTVYDLSTFAPSHPGGAATLLQHAGRDATAAYTDVHSLSLIQASLPLSSRIGALDQASVPEGWSHPLDPSPSSASVQQKHKQKPPLDSLLSAHDFAAAALLSFSPKAYAFVSSAATDCHTASRNASAYARITLRPRVLRRDVRVVSTATTILGCGVGVPFFAAPTSMGKVVHAEGERGIVRGCKARGVGVCVSTSASYGVGEVVAALEEEEEEEEDKGGDGKGKEKIPLFFQLYVDKDRAKSEKLLQVVRAHGIKGIFLTVDAPVIGKREADERVQSDVSNFTAPMSGAQAKSDKKGGALGRLMGGYIDASLTWADVAWLRAQVPGLPVAIKGIQTAMDAVRALEAGADAIYVSNHGGRSLDTAPATILVLLELQKCCPRVFERMEVYVDGGVTRGTDVFKALCLGARAVGVGRGFLYALGYGREGVERFVDSKFDLRD